MILEARRRIPEGDDASRIALMDALRAFHEMLRLKDIRTVRYCASLVMDEPDEVERVMLRIHPPRYRLDDHRFDCRFDFRLELMNADDSAIGNMEVELSSQFDSDHEITGVKDETIGAYIDSNVFFIIYPYFREAIQSLSLRLGLPPIILAIIDRASPRPSGLMFLDRDASHSALTD
jgi:preprotein translocase subunit SecB